MSEIGARLRQERKRLGLSQREMGQLGGVAANAQGKYESGERLPKADYLAALASVGVDVLYVLTDCYVHALRVDDALARINVASGEPDALLVEVKHAARHIMSVIEELSNSYVVSNRDRPSQRNDARTGTDS